MIHILGVDGVGKSTLLNEMEAEGFSILRCPQFHLSTQAANHLSKQEMEIAKYFEDFGQKCDRSNRPDLKAWALFYAMTLYGKILKARHPFVLAERYPAFDIQIYTPIYLHLLARFSEENLMGVDFDMPRSVRDYIESVTGKEGHAESFQYIHRELSDPKSSVYSSWFAPVAGSRFVLLQASPETISLRLEAKAQGRQTEEFHEKAHFLVRIQQGYQQFLSREAEEDKLILTVDELSPKESAQILFQQLQKWK